MNVRPGDIARIVHPDRYGKLVSVLCRAPSEDFFLPDGQVNLGEPPHLAPCWVCEVLGDPVPAPLRSGGVRLAKFGSIPDKWLRPLRDNPGEDETISWAGLPKKVGEVA